MRMSPKVWRTWGAAPLPAGGREEPPNFPGKSARGARARGPGWRGRERRRWPSGAGAGADGRASGRARGSAGEAPSYCSRDALRLGDRRGSARPAPAGRSEGGAAEPTRGTGARRGAAPCALQPPQPTWWTQALRTRPFRAVLATPSKRAHRSGPREQQPGRAHLTGDSLREPSSLLKGQSADVFKTLSLLVIPESLYTLSINPTCSTHRLLKGRQEQGLNRVLASYFVLCLELLCFNLFKTISLNLAF